MTETTDRTPDEWDVPLGGIAQLPRMVYRRTQIDVAAADIRFALAGGEIAEAAATRIWEALGKDEFPISRPTSSR